MCEGVSLQRARLGEAFATHGAGVRLGAHVGQAVAQQVGRRGERLVAHLHNDENPQTKNVNDTTRENCVLNVELWLPR